MKRFYKNIIAMSAVGLAFSSQNAEAKIWRLNNNGAAMNPAISADFTGTLQQAHDNASVANGDTIHVEQSATSYGNCTFTKKLVLIGSGYFLADNPQTQVLTSQNSKVGSLTFHNTLSAGSSIWGIETEHIYAGVNDLTIARCFINTGTLFLSKQSTTITGVKVFGNFFLTYYNTASVEAYQTPGAGNTVDFYDNIFYSNWGSSAAVYLPNHFGGLFKNNTLFSPNNYSMQLGNYYVVNNILHGGAATLNNCVVEYNISTNANQTTAANGSGNTFSNNTVVANWAAMQTAGGASSVDKDKYYVLLAGSPALTAGKPLASGGTGTQCGAFAGENPYVLSGLPPVPNIFQFDIQSIPAGATTINATVSSKSNY